MKKIFLSLIILISFTILSPVRIFAHSDDNSPFFKINAKYSEEYNVLSTSLNDFELPQDLGVDQYLINEKIKFEIDTTALPVSDTIVAQTEFTWEYGDGEKATGLKNEHMYKNQGSYILKIFAKTRQDSSPQLFQSVLLNILPSKDYKLPTPVLKVNDWISKDPLSDVAKVKFGDTLGFDAEGSTGKIVEYTWDFGDGKSDTKVKTTHKIDRDLTLVFPILRVKDENGFFADTYVQLNNIDLTSDNALAHTIGSYNKLSVNNNKLLILLLFLGGILLLLVFRNLFRRTK